MPPVEWDIPFEVQTERGNLAINTPTTSPFGDADDYLILLDKDKCSGGPTPLRVSSDPIPQADGDILHPSFTPGYKIKLAFEFWRGVDQAARTVAIGADRRVMWDTLAYYLDALLRLDGRLIWTPQDYGDDRLLNAIRVVEWPEPSYDGVTTVGDFVVASRFPYVIDATEQDIPFDSSGPVAAENQGSTDYYPVIRMNGPLVDFILTNNTTGEQFVYDSSLPGAVTIPIGSYAEIDMFRNTIYMNGDGANLKAGVDVVVSSFFPLIPAVNMIQTTDGDGLILLNNAYR